MRRVFVLLIATISACSTGDSTSTYGEGLPRGAVLMDYPNNSTLKRAEVKSGLILLEEGDVQNGMKHGAWIKYYGEGKSNLFLPFWKVKNKVLKFSLIMRVTSPLKAPTRIMYLRANT